MTATATADSKAPWRDRPQAAEERQASAPYIPSGFADFAFFPDKTVDHLMQAVISLGAEHWTLRRRMLVLEAVLEARGLCATDEVERFTATLDQQREWTAERDLFIARVFDPLRANAALPSPTEGSRS